MASVPIVLYGCAPKPVALDTDLSRGQSVVKPGRPGFVVGASHAISDPPSGDIATEIARRTGFGLVVATGLADEKTVQAAAQGKLAFYAEIHGSSRRTSAGRIEVATVGVDGELARRLRALLELIRDAHLRGHPEAPRLEIVVEPAATRDGILRLPVRALHLELPRTERRDWREVYTAILAEFIAEAATLPAGR